MYQKPAFYRDIPDNTSAEVSVVDTNVFTQNGAFPVSTDDPLTMIPISDTIQAAKPNPASRKGARAEYISLEISGHFWWAQGVAALSYVQPLRIRMVIVPDRSPSRVSAVPMTWGQVFGPININGDQRTSTFASPLRVNRQDDYVILRDVIYNVDPYTFPALQGSISSLAQYIHTIDVHETIDLRGITASYSSNLGFEGAQSEQITNALRMYLLADVVQQMGRPQAVLEARLRFY